ncbi:MAG: type II toxin-antitoxin system HicA family toxin [Bacteroidetes bacterium]|nr:type II toxin-antitoxin system HicA family toxin [Bacteroidota bacterium]
MGKLLKIYLKVVGGLSDSNISFEDLRTLLLRLGFTEWIKGSHHIFYKEGVEEIINIQEKSKHGKAYQVKQIRNLILKLKLSIKENEK